MGSRKLVRDLFLAKQLLFPLRSRQVVISSRLRLVSTNNWLLGSHRFSVFNEFSEKLKGEVKSNPDIQKSIKQLKEKAGEIKMAKEELKVRTKQTTEKIYKSVDGVWTEAEATAKKVSANVKEKFSAATEEVKETFGLGKQDSGAHKYETYIVIVPTKQSRWGKKWEAFKEKMQGNPVIKRMSGISEPDVREAWERSDHPVVHKIQDYEIRRRDPSFSLPEFVSEVQEMIRPTLIAYFKGDVETLKKNCSPEVIERCKAEKLAYESQGMFFSNKILHISDVEVHETKLMGNSPIIIVLFQTQQIYCVMDKEGSITEGGKDTIQTVFYKWTMQQLDVEDQEEGALLSIWRLRKTQQLGMKALI
ncbi:hypothetical protein MKW92_022795 [Papaver armeniacum]|nr:hypothetical protein MKW92_022795 [Papaver armeniacum]